MRSKTINRTGYNTLRRCSTQDYRKLNWNINHKADETLATLEQGGAINSLSNNGVSQDRIHSFCPCICSWWWWLLAASEVMTAVSTVNINNILHNIFILSGMALSIRNKEAHILVFRKSYCVKKMYYLCVCVCVRARARVSVYICIYKLIFGFCVCWNDF
jgi:hypothetical protein